MNVAVLGASDKPDRYSYKAVEQLLANGHHVFPIHPKLSKILNQEVYSSLAEITKPIHTLSIYVNAERSTAQANEILALNPKRIIFNPGAENAPLFQQCTQAGISVLNACTLVLLSTHQF